MAKVVFVLFYMFLIDGNVFFVMRGDADKLDLFKWEKSFKENFVGHDNELLEFILGQAEKNLADIESQINTIEKKAIWVLGFSVSGIISIISYLFGAQVSDFQGIGLIVMLFFLLMGVVFFLKLLWVGKSRRLGASPTEVYPLKIHNPKAKNERFKNVLCGRIISINKDIYFNRKNNRQKARLIKRGFNCILTGVVIYCFFWVMSLN